jgi:hypothetical protein
MGNRAQHADHRVTPLIVVEVHPVINCCNEFRSCGESVTLVVHSDSAPLLSQTDPGGPIERRGPASAQAAAIARAVYWADSIGGRSTGLVKRV